jgi:hypothetical protein
MFLNGHFKGMATGETFNCEGLTDILIRVEGRNAFIAECKFWDGDKKFLETIDQLLGYTSWRDTKTAILVFNRKKNFGAVLKKINASVLKHPCYEEKFNMQSEALHNESTKGYLFHNPLDKERRLFLTILAFDIPVEHTTSTSNG